MPGRTSTTVPKWWIVNGPRRDGPYDAKQITAYLRSGNLNSSDLVIAVGTARQAALRDLPEFAPVIQEIAAAAPPPSSSGSAAPASLPFKVGEQLSSLRKKLPGLKKEAGERLGSFRDKVSDLKMDGLMARLRGVGKFLFGLVCWLLIEAWAVCLATKDQTMRFWGYVPGLFRSRRGQSAAHSDVKTGLWPTTAGGWTRIGIGYGSLLLAIAFLLTHSPFLSGTAGATRNARDILREAIALIAQQRQESVPADSFIFPRLAAALVKSGDVDGAKITTEMAKVKFTEGRLAEILQRIAIAQAERGQIDEALATARKIKSNNQLDPYVETLLKIALCQVTMGKTREALLTFAEAQQTAIKAQSRWMLREIVGTQAEAGLLDDAGRTMTLLMATEKQGIHGECAERAAVAVLVATAKRERNFENAEQALPGVSRKNLRDRMRSGLIPALIEAGQLEEARSLAEATETAWYQVTVLGEVAAAYEKAGRRSDSERIVVNATQVAESYPGKHVQASAFAEIAGYQQGSGDSAGASRTLDRALRAARLERESRYGQTRAFIEIAMIQYKAGNRSAARTTLSEAQQIVEGTKEKWSGKDEALAAVGYAMVKLDGASEAIGWSRKQYTPYAKACVLLGTAEALLGQDPFKN